MKKCKILAHVSLGLLTLGGSIVATAQCPSGQHLLCAGPMHMYNQSSNGWKVEFTTPTGGLRGSVQPGTTDLAASTNAPIYYCGAWDKTISGSVKVTGPGVQIVRDFNNLNNYGGTRCPDFVGGQNCDKGVTFNKHPNGNAGGDILIRDKCS